MNYREKALKASQEAHKKQVAVKLLDGIDKIVLEATELSARRWVWELMQNAKDVANEKVQIEIELGHNFVEFRHNGNPFEMEHLTYLIEQISTKERRSEDEINEKKTTGQFGTGFMTTHLLSKIVDLEGILLDKDTRVHKNFVLRLDRSATTIEGMKKNVDLAFEVFDRLDNDAESPALENYTKNQECDTKFRYLLDEKSLEIAKKGIEDLYASLPYTLVFLPQIEAVKIITKDSTDVYKNSATVPDGVVSISEIKSNSELIYIAHLSDNEVDIAIQLGKFKDKYFIEKPNVSVPTLFCDFPLIGSETFTFPVIVNSRYFYPTEPRDGIYLSEKDDFKINQNKELMVSAKDLYLKLLEHASQHWSDTLWLARTHLPENIDTEWFKENIQKPMREVLLKTAIVENQKGEFIYLKKNNENDTIAFFPFSDDNQIREKIWFFYKDIYPRNPPKKEHINHWYRIIWDDCNKKTIGTLTNNVKSFKNISGLAKQLSKNESNAFIWLNDFIRFIEENEPNLLDEFAVLPNQYGDFILKKDLNIDKNIPKELKDALKILGEDWYSDLLDINIKNAKIDKIWSIHSIIPALNAIIDRNEFFKFTEFTKQKLVENKIVIPDLISEIQNTLFNRKDDFIRKIKSFYGTNFNSNIENIIIDNAKDKEIRKAISIIISLFPEKENLKYRNDCYNLTKKFDNEIPIQNYDYKDLPNSTWIKADNWLFKTIISDIENLINIENLKEHLKLNNKSEFTEKDTLKWLNDFFKFLIENNKIDLLTENSIIYPNQKGDFCKKIDLSQDISIPEEFKNILAEFETLENPDNEDLGWKHQLLSIEIDAFNKTENKFIPKTVKDISNRINEIIRENQNYENDDLRNILFKLISYNSNKSTEKHKKIWGFSRQFYYDYVPESIETLQNSDDFDWNLSLETVLFQLIIDVSEVKYVDMLQNKIKGATKAIDWLHDLIDFIERNEDFKDFLNSEDYPILPNQNRMFYPKSKLFQDDGTINKILKEVLNYLKPEWIDELLDLKIHLPTLTKARGYIDIANEIDIVYKNLLISERESEEFKNSVKLLYNWFEDQDEQKMLKDFEWTYRHKAELFVSIIGDREEKEAVLSLAASGNSRIFSEIVKNKDITRDDILFFARNHQKIKDYREMDKDKEGVVSRKIFEKEQLELINRKLKKSFISIDELVNELLKKDIDFMDEREIDNYSKKINNPDFIKNIQNANEKARNEIYEYLKKNGYDVSGWSKVSNTIIKGVKKGAIEINLVTKSAENGIIFFNNEEKQILKNEDENIKFSELWVSSQGSVFEINLGKILEKWNTKLIKAEMFDFRNK